MQRARLFLYLLVWFPFISNGQQALAGNADFKQEISAWILQSAYKDAPVIAKQWAGFDAPIGLVNVLQKTRTKGIRSSALGYLLVRCSMQMDATMQPQFLQTWMRLMDQPDTKIAIAFLEQVEAWQFNQELLRTGNYRVAVKGKISFDTLSVFPAQAQAIKTDGWDAEPVNQVFKGPLIHWDQAQLYVISGKDTLSISAEKIDFSLIEGVFKGQKGGTNVAPVDLADFSINTKKGVLQSENATLRLPEQSSKGSLSIPLKRKAGESTYFLDFTANEPLQTPLGTDNWKASGRLRIAGDNRAIVGEPASIALFDGKKRIGILKSPTFWIRRNGNIDAAQATFAGFVGQKDSISHSNVNVFFDAEKQTWQLKPVQSQLLFEDSYHQMRVAADLAVLSMQAKRMDFYRISGRSQVPAWVESYDFYDEGRLAGQQGILTYDPLRVLYNYLAEIKRSTANLFDIAARNKRDMQWIKGGFVQFKHAGYLNFDEETNEVSFTRMGRHYAQVKFGQKDFDTFFVPSMGAMLTKDSANISLDLDEQKLIVRGVKEIMVSDSLKANFIPSNNQVVFGQGRDFDFQGEIKIGNYTFYGQGFHSNFGDFTVQMPKIDSMTFIPRLANGELGNRALGGQFRYASGTILLSPPNNKSGRLGIAAYPKLIIPKGVTSYFDEPWRAYGVYTKSHYFNVPSIELDSLTQKQITFSGSFFSDNLIPTIRTSLVLMPDQSFGFSYTSKLPIDLYKNKAKLSLQGPLKMDKAGLHADGILQVGGLQSTGKSYFMYPDSLQGNGVQGKYTSPDAAFGDHSLRWLPRVDSLRIHPSKPIALYQQYASLEGDLGIHAKSVFGFGKLRMQSGEFSSAKFVFGPQSWHADTANMRIGNTATAVLGEAVRVDANMLAKKITLKPVGDSPIIFPYVGYQSTLNEALWDMTNQRFTLSGKSGFELSPWSASDSIPVSQAKIIASSAEYDFKAQYLALGGVKEVMIGPALVFPAKGLFGIQKDGAFKAFSQARARIENQHVLTQLSSKEANAEAWKGEANYLFPRSDGDSIAVPLRNFVFQKQANKSWIEAQGVLPEKTPINLSKHQQFKGEVSLDSREESLRFKGFIRPVIGLVNFKTAWIPFENAKGELPRLTLNAGLRDEAGRPVTAGIYINAANKLYPTFLGPQSDDLDPVLFQAEGLVVEEKGQYEINGKSSSMRLFIDKHRMEAEGTLQLFTGKSPLTAVGKLQMSTDTLTPRMDSWLQLAFPFPPNLLKIMGDRIVKFNLDEGVQSESADEPERRDDYLKRVEQLLGHVIPEPTKTKMDQVHLALDKVDPVFANSINFAQIHWLWSPNTSSFYTTGNLALVNAGPVDVNATLKGFMEVIKKPSKEEFYGYWEAGEDLWYYFAYFNSELGVFSSDNAFLAAIREAVKNDKKGKSIVVEAAADEKDAFVKRFNAYYRAIAPTTKKPAKKEVPKPKTKQTGF